MMCRSFLGWLLFTILGQGGLSSQLPDVALDIAVRKRENGRMTQAFKLFRLRCREGACNLISLDFNDCRGDTEKLSFRPSLSLHSTAYGDVTVTSEPRLLTLQLTMSEPGGPVDATLRIGYTKRILW